MKKVTLKIKQTVRYPFYQAMMDVSEEEFLDDEYKIVWEEAEEIGLVFSAADRIEIFKVMDCVLHFHHDGIDYFFCYDPDKYWDELSVILDKKGNQ
ncbi:MAG TPA: hypothetical protein VJ824_03495 [Bacillota bacterium]|nr:hypothetical protein [Bacillota bacterium]